MKVKLLVINDIQDKLGREIGKVKSRGKREESQEEYINRVVHGIEPEDNNQEIIIDLSSELEETDFHFRIEKVDSIYRLMNGNNNLMIVNINGMEYDCIFEQEKYDEIIKHLN